MSATLRQPGLRRERWLTPGQRKLLAACAATVGVIAAYKVYRSERLTATQKALQTAADTLARCNDTASSVGQIAAILARDINIFLSSDASEVPQSLRQLAKLARSSDVQDTLAACVASSLKGVMDMDARSRDSGEPTLVDKVIQAVLSDRGQTLVGLAVRTAAQQSTETFCAAVRSGLEAALQATGTGGSQQQQQQHIPKAIIQQQHPCNNSGASQSAADGFFSAMSTPISSPQQPRQHTPNFAQVYTSGAGYSSNNMHPVLSSVMSVLSSPQLLQAVDGLVSTCVSSTVGAYLSQAPPSESMLSSTLHTLSQPANKALVIDIMSQVSASFCREMAAACVAPAATVASRPGSRLSDSPGMLCLDQEDQHLRLQRQISASPIRIVAHADSSSRLPHKQGPTQQQQDTAAAMHHSVSEHVISHASDAAAAAAGSISEPSSPQSGPGTPEPSVAAAEAAGSSSHIQQPRQSPYGSFAGSAVAGLILRRQSLSGLLSGSCAAGTGQSGSRPAAPGQAGTLLVDPATLGPMSTAVSLFVQAARFQEFRSLMVDVSRSSTREFVHSLLPRGWLQVVRGGSSRQGGRTTSGVDVAMTVALQRVYTAMSVLILLMVYALSPKMLQVQGGM